MKFALQLGFCLCFLLIGNQEIQAVNKQKGNISTVRAENEKKALPAIPTETVIKMEKKAKRAIIFSLAGVVLVIGIVVVLSLGTMVGALPMLGVAALFANIGFLKAMRIRSQTKSRKRTYAKARKRAKTALILSCVLGITLILGLLSLLVEKGAAF